MITDNHLVCERSHHFSGVQRIYRFAGNMGLSLVNSPMLHDYRFAWEAAVVSNVTASRDFRGLRYDTELTDDVEVFMSDDEANAFIERAARLFGEAKPDA